MSLSVGTKLGPYEVVGAIGAGGMGEVYRATDTKLNREVAIKALPSALAGDADRLARFDREAKLLAALNHPNIAVIYGLEEHDGMQCIAMELIEGETLEEKLKDGPLSVEDALPLALQIAQALEAAHEKGVVHRDLKPANVMITAKGQVKVLDFGLAKAFSEEANEAGLGQSPALSLAMTQQGIILGTAGYMSPEQASGQATDQRADVWAFGVVLFEMLSGLPLFKGESVPHILADILKTEPDWNKLPKNLHPRLKFMLERCLAKKPRSRYHAIADARIDIEAVLSDPDGALAPTRAQGVRLVRPSIPWLAASIGLTAVVVGLFAWTLWPTPEPALVTRFSYEPADGQSIRVSNRRVAALSPDGRQFVYSVQAGDGLYLRAMNELDARLIAGTDSNPNPLGSTFSPDGQSIAYSDASGQLNRIAVSGGAPVVIADLVSGLYGMSWGVDGTILVGQSDGIYRVAATGGTLELVISTAEVGEFPYGPRLLPDGDSVLFGVVAATDWDNAQIVAQSLSTGERTVLINGGSDARYLPTGHLIYALGDGLFAVSFDLDSLTVSGVAVPLLQGVRRASVGLTGVANYDISENGTLLYVAGDLATLERTLVWVDREGRETPLGVPPRAYVNPRISPDGGTVALDIRDQDRDIWIWDLTRETLTRLTFDPGEDEFPVWSPDGRRIAFSSTRQTGIALETSLFSRAADGSGSAEELAESVGQIFPTSFLPDASELLVFGQRAGGGDDNIASFRLEGGQSTPLLDTVFEESYPQISPDGRWLAYTSNESGNDEVYVRPYPDVSAGGRWQVSTGGGTQPLWARNGQELFYRDGDTVIAVPVQADSTFVAGNPEIMFEGDYLLANGGPNYDVSPDGEQFLMIKDLEGDSSALQIVVVENWFEEFNRLAPTDN